MKDTICKIFIIALLVYLVMLSCFSVSMVNDLKAANDYLEEADNTIRELNEVNHELNKEIGSLKSNEPEYYKEYSYSYESKAYSYEYEYKETIPRKGLSWLNQ